MFRGSCILKLDMALYSLLYLRPLTAKHLKSAGVPQWRTALSRLWEQRCPATGEGYRWIVPPRLLRTTGKRTKLANRAERAASLGGERIAPLQGGGGGYLGGVGWVLRPPENRECLRSAPLRQYKWWR